jgi:HSP20 family protein
MAATQELQVQKKRELENKEETTIPARIFVPAADIYEAENDLTVVLEMPGVEKNNVEVRVEDGVLNVEGATRFSKIPRSAAALYGIQHWSLRAELPAF